MLTEVHVWHLKELWRTVMGEVTLEEHVSASY